MMIKKLLQDSYGQVWGRWRRSQYVLYYPCVLFQCYGVEDRDYTSRATLLKAKDNTGSEW